MSVHTKWNNTSSTHSIFCNSLLLLFHQLLSVLDALQSRRYPTSCFFCLTLGFISHWLQYLASFAFDLRGKCFLKKMPRYFLTLRQALHCHLLLCHHLKLWCQLHCHPLPSLTPGHNAIFCCHPYDSSFTVLLPQATSEIQADRLLTS